MWGPNEFSTSAAWVDYDRDGKLDLVVANYVQWTPQSDIYCTLDGTTKSYCTPESYKGASLRLWHNLGNGKFEDATAKAGLLDNTSKSLGLAILDANGDGWPDIVVANDTQPNKLYINTGKGTFTESAVSAGIAFSEDGVARAGMGVDAADYDRSGRPSIIIGNFSNQMMALYHNEGNGLFVDEAPRSEVGRNSLLTLGFACFFFDYDLDGWLDIFVANGHIENGIERIQKRVKYAQSPHLFHNQGAGKFVETTKSVGPDLSVPRVGRSAAYADIDNDGDLDVLLTTNGGPAVLFRNEGVTNHSLRIKLVGTQVESRRHRHRRNRECRRRETVAHPAQRLRLPFGERTGAHLRTRTTPTGGRDRVALAERPGRSPVEGRRGTDDHGPRRRRYCAAAAVRKSASARRFASGDLESQGDAMKPVTQQSAVELLALLRESKISPLELADEYIAQIERLNPQSECAG